ncbi:transcriptional regulator, GntR family [Rubrobacter xylanophilus DSM 9941]|uniref:Transcriptional regulator, GntR family n=1 Tax=Rubrobacter xylanophilus (strain DSM 9941 / JCM 11954 / NBRC 16129 / PRD-1) TaxID=266117 RepID=Q1AX84_RUBXD|nr:GntR family transcriptional regulator [Rubrobacter xylanophilus]ABG03994.1 transcriptional regulator, GntR family [Rubrobacter xylanophilus DSM 9941]
MDAVSRGPKGSDPIRVDSVVDLAYRRIRDLVLSGELAPGARLGQVELAERFGISRTPVREALRRLAGEGLVDQISNRGFRVADLGLDAVLRRLEVRAILEPGIAGLAAERRSGRDLEAMRAAIEREERASSGIEAHDASRDFHLALARATGNEELVRVLESLWLVEVGRRLLSRRYAVSDWQAEDVAEHREILAAVDEGRAPDAERLMAEHVRRAVQHWEPERRGARETG